MAFDAQLMQEIRDRFAHVDRCPISGERIFFENAGGSLTLKSVVETSAYHAAIPDNQGRANATSKALVEIIARGKADMMEFLGAPGGQVFVGESGTEVLFRLIRAACLASAPGGQVLGSTLEHPASRSAAALWAARSGLTHVLVPHDDATGTVTPAAYAARVKPQTRVATIVHTSPVTGMGVDVPSIVAEIRAVSPDCLVVIDGIQHAAHGPIDLSACDADGYAISPYKMFSRHGYGVGWLSERLAAAPHDHLIGGPEDAWELGTRDTGAYATLSDVITYLDWLGERAGGGPDRKGRLAAAGAAIHAHEAALCAMLLHGVDNLPGLADLPGVVIIGGADNPAREGLVSFWIEGRDTAALIAAAEAQGIRMHIRKNDHYSGNILGPLGRQDCIRLSLCHYNAPDEIARFLSVFAGMLERG